MNLYILSYYIVKIGCNFKLSVTAKIYSAFKYVQPDCLLFVYFVFHSSFILRNTMFIQMVGFAKEMYNISRD